jgi:hypothetical protein
VYVIEESGTLVAAVTSERILAVIYRTGPSGPGAGPAEIQAQIVTYFEDNPLPDYSDDLAELDTRVDALEEAGPHEPAGTAAAAVAAHVAATDPHGDRAHTAVSIATHVAATDPHGDRAHAAGQLTAHVGATDPHGDRAHAAGLVATEVINRNTAIATAVATLEGLVDAEAADRAAAIVQEVSDRNAAIAAMRDAIIDGAPTALDTLLEIAEALGDAEDELAALLVAIDSKETPAGAQAKVDLEATARAAAVAAEVATRLAADQALGERIDEEEAARIAGDGDVAAQAAADLALESTAREDGDAALGTRIDEEHDDWVEGDATVANDASEALSLETANREAAVADLATGLAAEVGAREDLAATVGDLPSTFAELDDVDWATPPTDGQMFVWDQSTGKLVPTDVPEGGGGPGATAFEDLTDVDWSTPPTDGQIFAWDAATSKLVPVDPPTGGGGAVETVAEVTPVAGDIERADLVAALAGEDGLALDADLDEAVEAIATKADADGVVEMYVLNATEDGVVRVPGRIFLTPVDPATVGVTPQDGDIWEVTDP